MTDSSHPLSLPAFTPALPGFRAEEFLALTETLLAVPLEQDAARLNLVPFRLSGPEPRPDKPLPALPPRRYPRPAQGVIDAARARLAPPPRAPLLAGRSAELERVLRPLLSGHPVTVQGEPGVGKTALLAAVAAHERTRQRFRRIWWFDRAERLDQTLALALGLPHVLAELDPAARRARLAEHLDDHTLLIVDNARPGDPALDGLPALTAHLLLALDTPPDLPDPDEPPPPDPDGVVTLRALDEAAAVEALAHFAELGDARALRGDLRQVAVTLGCYPFALMLAGRLVSRDGLSLGELADALALDTPPEIPGSPAPPAPEPPADPDNPDNSDAPAGPAESGEPGQAGDPAPAPAWSASLNRALDVSFAALPREYRTLFAAFAAFPPDGAPFEGLCAAAHFDSTLACRRGLVMLARYGFILPDHGDPAHYRMHPVVYAHAAAHDPHAPKNALGKRMRAWAVGYARAHAADPLALYRVEASLLFARDALAAAGPESQHAALSEALRPYLRDYMPAALAHDPAAGWDELTGPRAEGAALTAYGLELTDQGAYYAAEEALARALELRRAHDSDHAIAETLVALARLHDVAGRYPPAAERLIEAAELLYRLGAEPSLSVVRRGLARVYRHLGRLTDALDVLDDAPEAHLERAAILRAQGNYAAAVAEIDQAPEASPYDRAELFLLAGRYAEALAAIADQHDPASAHLRAQVYHLQGAVGVAIQGYQAALDCCPDDDLARAQTLRGLGAALASDGQAGAACAAFEEALAIYQARTPPDPLQVGRVLRLLAAVHAALGDDRRAVTTARAALDYLNQVNAPGETADACRTLGRALWRMGDAAGALTAFSGEVEAAQAMPARDETRIGLALHHLADAHRATGSLERAVANYRRALTHLNPVTELDATFITQLALHRALLEQNRVPTALDVAQEVVDLLAKQSPPDLARLGYALAALARTQQAAQRPIRAMQSVNDWARLLAARAPQDGALPPALRLLLLGLAVRSLLAEERPALALALAEEAHALAGALYPNTPAAWAACRDLGEVYSALDRPEETILTLAPLLDDAVRAHPPTYALARELIGRAYRQIGDPAAALEHLGAAFDAQPEAHRRGLLLETIGHILLDTGQPAQAVERFQAALDLLDRQNAPDAVARVLTALAHTLGGLNRYAEAIGVYEDALAALRNVDGVSPVHTADVLRALGQTHEAQGQLPEAARAYRRALNVLERADAPHPMRDILHQLARVTAALGDQSAVQLYEQARSLTEQWGDVQQLGRLLCELANFHRDSGRLLPAVQTYQAALDCQPAQLLARERLETLRNLGRAYAGLGRYDEARAAWTEALTLSHDLPGQPPLEIALTHHAIAEAHRHQAHYAEAEQAYHQALKHHTPGTLPAAATWFALGQARYAAGRYDEAVEALRAALDIEKAQPQQANARIVAAFQALAAAHEAGGDLAAAITRHHEALGYMDRALQPIACADTLRTLGRLYGAAEQYEQALTAYQDALEIEGHYVPRSDERISATLQAIADTYRAAGDLERAAEFYQKVTVYANLARRASEDLRETLDELERRRATLQAAQQSLALLDRSDAATLKDLAFIHALIAHSYAALNRAQESADAINTLLDLLVERRGELDPDDAQPDVRALAWLAAVRRAEDYDDLVAARQACEIALGVVRNANLRWVIEQVADSLA